MISYGLLHLTLGPDFMTQDITKSDEIESEKKISIRRSEFELLTFLGIGATERTILNRNKRKLFQSLNSPIKSNVSDDTSNNFIVLLRCLIPVAFGLLNWILQSVTIRSGIYSYTSYTDALKTTLFSRMPIRSLFASVIYKHVFGSAANIVDSGFALAAGCSSFTRNVWLALASTFSTIVGYPLLRYSTLGLIGTKNDFGTVVLGSTVLPLSITILFCDIIQTLGFQLAKKTIFSILGLSHSYFAYRPTLTAEIDWTVSRLIVGRVADILLLAVTVPVYRAMVHSSGIPWMKLQSRPNIFIQSVLVQWTVSFILVKLDNFLVSLMKTEELDGP